MKKMVFTIFILFFSISFAENLTGGVYRYSDALLEANLTNEQIQAILYIQKEEEKVITPLVLELQAKEEGLELLNSMKCRAFDSNCKKLLKADIEQREFEKREVERKINQKKSYYNIRYKNILTRAQNIQVQQIVNENTRRDKVMAERAEAAEKQEKIDKLKFWKKIFK